MDISIEQTDMILPSTMAVNDQLDDASLKMIVSTNGMQVMEMNVHVTDRKEEKLEEITTEAGTYSCALVSYKTEVKMGFVNTVSYSKDWYSPEVGVVKSDYFDKNHALKSSRVLVGYSK